MKNEAKNKKTPRQNILPGLIKKKYNKGVIAGVQSRAYENEIKYFQEAPQRRLTAASSLNASYIIC